MTSFSFHSFFFHYPTTTCLPGLESDYALPPGPSTPPEPAPPDPSLMTSVHDPRRLYGHQGADGVRRLVKASTMPAVGGSLEDITCNINHNFLKLHSNFSLSVQLYFLIDRKLILHLIPFPIRPSSKAMKHKTIFFWKTFLQICVFLAKPAQKMPLYGKLEQIQLFMNVGAHPNLPSN